MKLQGKQINGAEWRNVNTFIIEVPEHQRTARAFYVGRIITLEIRP